MQDGEGRRRGGIHGSSYYNPHANWWYQYNSNLAVAAECPPDHVLLVDSHQHHTPDYADAVDGRTDEGMVPVGRDGRTE